MEWMDLSWLLLPWVKQQMSRAWLVPSEGFNQFRWAEIVGVSASTSWLLPWEPGLRSAVSQGMFAGVMP